MDIKTLAVVLLTAHLVSIVFIALVLVLQAKLFKKKVQPSLIGFRRLLFVLALVVFTGNLVPIGVDALTIFSLVERSSSTINPIGVAYSVSNAVVFGTSALLIWFLYRMAATTVLITERDKKTERDKLDLNK